MEITNLSQLDPDGNCTYADYLLWKFRERVELFRGKILEMSPAPSSNHQRILMKINRLLGNYFRKNQCKIFYAPFDVRFPDKNGTIKTVLQPDLCVICDPNNIDDRGCLSAPDLIVEILPPGKSKKELSNKYKIRHKRIVGGTSHRKKYSDLRSRK